MYFPSPSDTLPSGTLSAPVITRTVVDEQELRYLAELKAELSIDDAIKDYDNALLRKLRTAIGAIEEYTAVGMQPQMITVSYSGYDGAPLPFGPVWLAPVIIVTPSYEGATIVINDTTGERLSEGSFPHLSDFSAGATTYKAGYSRKAYVAATNDTDEILADPYIMPDGLIGAVLEHAASSFRTGGISGGTMSTYWKTLAGPYRRF